MSLGVSPLRKSAREAHFWRGLPLGSLAQLRACSLPPQGPPVAGPVCGPGLGGWAAGISGCDRRPGVGVGVVPLGSQPQNPSRRNGQGPLRWFRPYFCTATNEEG